MYFRKVPDILYLKYNKNPYDGNYILIKNIFARIKLIDNIVPSATVFEDYFIQDGERPDTIAFDYYGSSTYDWLILIINNMKSIYEDWPKNQITLNSYIEEKYDYPLDVHHYETIEQFYNGKKVLDEGLEVSETFQFVLPNGNILPLEQSRGPVSNYTYEVRENDKKREILILKPSLLDEFIQILEEELKFTPSTEFINDKLKYSNN